MKNKICNSENSSDLKSLLDDKLKNLNWPYISPENYEKAINDNEKIALIDVRKSLDCCFVGINHPKVDVYSIPLNNLLSEICKVPLDDYDKIICICVGGPKSAVAASVIRFFGYQNCFFLGGGLNGLVKISNLTDHGDV